MPPDSSAKDKESKQHYINQAFQNLIKNKDTEIFIHNDGYCEARKPTFSDKILRTCNLGGFSKFKVKKFFDQHTSLILDLMHKWRETPEGIWQLQSVLNTKLGEKDALNLCQTAYADWMTKLSDEKKCSPFQI